VTDFVNLKIKSTQSFRCAYKSKMYVCIYRSECSYIYKYLYLYYISEKSLTYKCANEFNRLLDGNSNIEMSKGFFVKFYKVVMRRFKYQILVRSISKDL
jgi:hypothetical protein